MKKGRIINFEWMCDYNHYSSDEFEVIKTKLIKKDILNAAKDGCNIIVGLYLLDGFLQPKTYHEKFILFLNDIKSYADSIGIEKIYLISGLGETLDNCPFEHFYFDYNLRITHNSYKDLSLLPKFNQERNKFLFLTGMPNRPNRIGLLSKYYDRGLLDKAEWSFFAPWTEEDKIWCRNHLSYYDDLTYNKFLNDCERSFDNRFDTAKPFYGSYCGDTDIVWYDILDVEWIRAPAHIDSKVFENTFFSVISEGPNYWNDDNDFITEKSWRTFLHSHPFIFAGHPDQFRYLKKLGFKTFEEYMVIKDYALIDDENKRLNAVVNNTLHWLNNKNTNIDLIKKDIEHNFERFFYYLNKQNELCEYLKTDLMVPDNEVDYYLTNSIGYTNIIRKIPDGI